VADLDEPVNWEERIKVLQEQIDEMKKLQREEQLGRRKALRDRVDELGSLPESERKSAIQEQIEDIKQLYREQQDRQKALLQQLNEMKQQEKEQRKERKRDLRLGFVLKLGKARDETAPVQGHPIPQDQWEVEARKGFLKMHILLALSTRPAHGYELMQWISNHTGHAWTPSPGSMYPALDALESRGFISCQGDGRRKVYSLTSKGEDVMARMKKKQEEQFLEMKTFMSALFDE
jgi:DNA-binding PadR family transcriptional regulator